MWLSALWTPKEFKQRLDLYLDCQSTGKDLAQIGNFLRLNDPQAASR